MQTWKFQDFSLSSKFKYFNLFLPFIST